jgi:RHS repeat-associated protein
MATTGMPMAASGNTFNADNEMTAFNGTTLTGACPERSRRNADGNLTNDGTNTYTWDARGHLSTLAGTNVAAYQYDAFGRRVQNTLNGVMTQYLYDGVNAVAEMDGATPPNPTATMLTGLDIDEYFQRADSSGTLSYLTDMLGSTVALADSSGAVDTTYAYDPFGNVTVNGADTNPYQFTGRENDGTGLYYYRARYYSPTFQRFVSQDPIGFATGDTNLYRYALDAPTIANDPLGLLTFSLGFSVNLQLWLFNVSASVGIVADTCGNVGSYNTGGLGTGVGAEGNGGITFGYSNAPTIADLAGPFANTELGAGAGAGGSFGIFTGGSPDGQVTGGSLTIGVGGGAGGSVGLTGTRITQFNSSSPCSCK